MPLPRSTWLRAALAAVTLTAAALPAAADVPAAERDALVALYQSTNGAGWTDSTNWLSGDPCGPAPWFGVVCGGGPVEHHVREIHLSANNLAGSVPGLSAFTALERINLSDNALSGPVPSLAGLNALVGFWADNNQFSGYLPDISTLPALGFFYMNNNQLIGPIPDISGMTTLIDFRVSTNRLTGTPPAPPASLNPGGSSLCPNYLHAPSPDDTAWSAATGELDWSRWCTPGYLVAASAGSGGSISPTPGSAVLPGETASFTLVAAAGYRVGSVTSSCGGTLTGDTFTTGPVTADCTVTAAFSALAVPTAVPTLAEGALALLGGLMAALGLRRLRRRA